MNKQIEIEDMAFDLCRIDTCKHLPQAECHNTTCAHCEAEALYNAGYRKASEVAREIVNDVKETLLDFHLREDKKYSASKTKKRKQFDIETARYRAITDAIKFAIVTLNEIEKKYTEGEE